jgi:hypothetical protein
MIRRAAAEDGLPTDTIASRSGARDDEIGLTKVCQTGL